MAFEDIHRPLSAAGFRGAVRWIISISAVMLLLIQFVPQWIGLLGLVPARVVDQYWLWQPVTYLFLHSGIFHWLFNMLILWMFGRELEVRWGTPFFVRYFFICGIGAAGCVLLISPHSVIPTIGASGAIFGLLAAFAMVFPEAVLYLYFVVPVKAWQAVILFGFIELFAGMQGGGAGLGRFAHLGGMLTGYLYLKSREHTPLRLAHFFRDLGGKIARPFTPRAKRPVVFHEVTDELVKEVDHILEKILREGAENLTPHEKEIMERYSRLKH
jgi:membrane associated rhomboid family serine protease